MSAFRELAKHSLNIRPGAALTTQTRPANITTEDIKHILQNIQERYDYADVQHQTTLHRFTRTKEIRITPRPNLTPLSKKGAHSTFQCSPEVPAAPVEAAQRAESSPEAGSLGQ